MKINTKQFILHPLNILIVMALSFSYQLTWANNTVETLPILSGVGGNFNAIDSNGKNIEFNDYKGKVVILAFGYTNCADICPFTLGYLKGLYSLLSTEEKQAIKVLFVTVDPKYDTPKHLKGFVGYFNKDFIGLSGTQKQVDHIVSLYQAEYHELSALNIPTKEIRRTTAAKKEDKHKEDKTKLFSHTVTLYLIDKSGNTRSLQYTGTPKENFVKNIQQLINE